MTFIFLNQMFICFPAVRFFFDIAVSVTMEKSKLRVIFEYEFRRGTNATQTARNINDVYGPGTASERTVRFWFDRFRSVNFDVINEPRGRPETKVDNDELKAIVEADSSQTTSELAAAFNVSDKTIFIHLRQIGKIKKLGKWVPYKLTVYNNNKIVHTPHNGPSQNYRSYDWKLSVTHRTHQTLLQLIVIFFGIWITFYKGKISSPMRR